MTDQISECGQIPTASNASYTSNGTGIGQIIIYSCDPGFLRTSGAIKITCLENGQWSSNIVVNCTGEVPFTKSLDNILQTINNKTSSLLLFYN